VLLCSAASKILTFDSSGFFRCSTGLLMLLHASALCRPGGFCVRLLADLSAVGYAVLPAGHACRAVVW
jgi:hypothetical protein